MGRTQALGLTALAVGVALAIALSTCGGDDSPEQPITVATVAPEALSKADYIDEADALCADTTAVVEQLVEAGEGFTGSGEIADLRQNLLDELNSLGPPTDDQATLDQFLTALAQQVDAGQKIALAIQRDEDSTQFEADLDAAQADAQAAAEQYGFKDCGGEVQAAGGTGDTGGVPVEPAPAPAPPPDDSGGTDVPGGGGVGIP